MASSRAKQFKQKLEENKGKTIVGISTQGKSEKMYGKVIEVWDEEKIIHVDIKSPYISASDKIDLQMQCKYLLPYVKEYKEGEKICMSNFCNTIFDMKLMLKNLTNGKQFYQFVTI